MNPDKMSARFKKAGAFAFFACALSWSPLAQADELVAIGNLPQSIVETINARYPGARYLSAERETYRAEPEYEVTICHNGQQLEVELTPAGVITDIDFEGPC